MGYESKFEVQTTPPTIVALPVSLKIEGQPQTNELGRWESVKSRKWYSYKKQLAELSESHPGVLFRVKRVGDETLDPEDDTEITWIRDGMLYSEFVDSDESPQFDPKRLESATYENTASDGGY
jgi:hypothetical protein